MRTSYWMLLGLSLLPRIASAQPAVSFDGASVEVAGITPGSPVAIATVQRGLHGLIPFQSRSAELVVDEDGDGVVRADFSEDLPPRSLAVAVDLTDGSASAAAADGDLVWRELPPGAVVTAGRHILEPRRYLEVLLVRPGEVAPGAWAGAFGDGSASDEDGVRDHGVRAAIARLLPVGASPPTPDRVAAGDVLVVVDPETLELFTARLGQ